MTTPRRRWFRFRFSLRAMLVLVLVVSVVCGWLRWRYDRAQRERDAVAALNDVGWQTGHQTGWDPSDFPYGWNHSVIEDWSSFWFRNFESIQITCAVANEHLTEMEIEHLRDLHNLKELVLGNTPATDAAISRLTGLRTIRHLDLEGTSVTDAGLAHVARLTQLKVLVLDRTRVTDAGLAQLRRLTELKILYLCNCDVTEAGVLTLQKSLPGLYVQTEE